KSNSDGSYRQERVVRPHYKPQERYLCGKSFKETSAPRPAPSVQTLLAHFSNSGSCVTPRSSVIGANSVRPGDLRLLLGSPPSRCLTTSVVRFSPPTLLTPAT